MDTMTFTPLNKNVLLKLKVTEEKTQQGLILPTVSKQSFYEVIAVSDMLTISVKVGDTVLIHHNHGGELELEGVKYRLVDQASVVGIVYG